MEARNCWLLVVLPALVAGLVALRLANRGDGHIEPRSLGGGPVRQTIDLLAPPAAAAASMAGRTLSIPGQPDRFLVARLDKGELLLGWAGEAGAIPADACRVATRASRILAWVDRKRGDVAVVAAYAGATPDAPHDAVEIRFTAPP
jgi:hypothetical protein